MRNISAQFVEKIKIRILFSKFLFENNAVYEVIWKNTVVLGGRDADYNTIWRMRIACWVSKATNTQLGYVMLIAFSLQQCLHVRV
jgi:hypothetical protein